MDISVNNARPGPEPRLIQTNNRTGYITTHIDPIIKLFIEEASVTKGAVLELGAGYGLPSLEAIARGARNVTINDLDPGHLDYARLHAKHPERLRVVAGSVPDGIALPSNTYDIILASRFLHFFDGPTIDRTAQKISEWLKPGGRVLIVCDTMYVRQFAGFSSEYDIRKKRGEQWPGYFCDIGRIHLEREGDLPPCFHYFEPETLTAPFVRAGLQLMHMSLFERPEYPEEKRLDGRDAIGIVARKPPDAERGAALTNA